MFEFSLGSFGALYKDSDVKGNPLKSGICAKWLIFKHRGKYGNQGK